MFRVLIFLRKDNVSERGARRVPRRGPAGASFANLRLNLFSSVSPCLRGSFFRPASRRLRAGAVLCAGVAIAVLLGGCAAPNLNLARENFYAGNLTLAAQPLDDIPSDHTDRVLYLMERGSVKQAAHDYEGSAADWLAAADLAEWLDYYSVSRGSTSFLVNDKVMAFRGAPYERTLVHTFAATSYMALSLWEDAAVEARNIVDRLDTLDGFPDDAYSHYLAGFCFELVDDSQGAAFQYRAAAALAPHLRIDDSTGAILPAKAAPAPGGNGPVVRGPELVCFVGIGRAPTERQSGYKADLARSAPYAEIYADDRYLGRSYALTATPTLLADTEKRLAARTTAKTATRVALKEVAAQALESENEVLGDLLRFILFSMETPDTRRWETLPRYLGVARVPCPPDLRSYTVIFKGRTGTTLGRRTVTIPITRRRDTVVSFCRDL